MRRKWFRTILAATLTLAMAFAVMGGFGGERAAKAAITDGTLNQSNQNITQNTAGTIVASISGATVATVGNQVKYTWSVTGFGSVNGNTGLTATSDTFTYTAANTAAVGSAATITCTIEEVDTDGASLVPAVTTTKSFTVTVVAAPTPPASTSAIVATVCPTPAVYNYSIPPSKGQSITFVCDVTSGGTKPYSYSNWVSSDTSVLRPAGAGTSSNFYVFDVVGYGTATVSCTVTDSASPANTRSFTSLTVQNSQTASTVVFKETQAYASPNSGYDAAANLNTTASKFSPNSAKTWSVAPAGAGVTISTAGYVTVASNATKQAYTVTLGIGEWEEYSAGSGSFTLTVADSTAISVAPTTVTMATTGLSQTINVTSAVAIDVSATSSRSDGNAVVSCSTPVANSLANGYTFVITGMNVGTSVVSVRPTNSGNTVKIAVTVGTVSSGMTVTYSPNITELGKGSYTYAYVHVDNPTSNYVKLTRGNTRVYVEGYNYSHPSTNTYYSTLDAAGNATFLIRPQYTGSVAVSFESGSATSNRTFYVSGYPTMPQTGPNYTPIYIVSGLCLALAATAVTLNVRKKRKDEQSV